MRESASDFREKTSLCRLCRDFKFVVPTRRDATWHDLRLRDLTFDLDLPHHYHQLSHWPPNSLSCIKEAHLYNLYQPTSKRRRMSFPTCLSTRKLYTSEAEHDNPSPHTQLKPRLSLRYLRHSRTLHRHHPDRTHRVKPSSLL